MTPRNTISALILVVSALLMTSGCATRNSVDHITWVTSNTFYIAYESQTGVEREVNLRRCDVQPDNTVVCVQQPEASAAFNKKD